MNIYIITHKEFNDAILKYDCYIPLFVGYGENKCNYLRDNKGINIAKKNDSYCELTGLYWIWKNVRDEIVGLEHYHRFFVKIKKKYKRIKGRYLVFSKLNCYELLSPESIRAILDDYDLIIKNSVHYSKKNRDVFNESLSREIILYVEDLIKNEYPSYYSEFIRMMNKHTHYNCNMFIGFKKIIDLYCEWLFEVLEKVDMHYIKMNGERLHNRELGYVGEMLFETWILTNHIKHVCVDAINTTSNFNYEEVVTPVDCILNLVRKESR